MVFENTEKHETPQVTLSGCLFTTYWNLGYISLILTPALPIIMITFPYITEHSQYDK